VDTKFDKARARAKATEGADSDNIIKPNNLSVKDGSHRVRVAQDIARDDDKSKRDTMGKCSEQARPCHSRKR
jgi:hypothetical protein